MKPDNPKSTGWQRGVRKARASQGACARRARARIRRSKFTRGCAAPADKWRRGPGHDDNAVTDKQPTPATHPTSPANHQPSSGPRPGHIRTPRDKGPGRKRGPGFVGQSSIGLVLGGPRPQGACVGYCHATALARPPARLLTSLHSLLIARPRGGGRATGARAPPLNI
jgi:hypothetical protein